MNNDHVKLLGTCCIWLGSCMVVAFSILGISVGYTSQVNGAVAPGYCGLIAGVLVAWQAFMLIQRTTAGRSGNN